MEKLKEYIYNIIPMSDEDWMEMSQLFTMQSFKKGEVLYDMYDIPDRVSFIYEGIVRSYKLEENGKDFTWSFYWLSDITTAERMISDVCVVDYANFVREKPAELVFEALEDCKVVSITKEDLFNLYKTDNKWHDFAWKVAEDAYFATRDRTLTMLTKSAKERLEVLLTIFPTIFEKVPHYHIASYLGIAGPSLSRLRKEVDTNLPPLKSKSSFKFKLF